MKQLLTNLWATCRPRPLSGTGRIDGIASILHREGGVMRAGLHRLRRR